MLLWIFRLVKSVRRALLSQDTPRQLAWGIALGLLLGLIPKGNLLAISVAVMILSLTANHALAIATAALVMLSGTWIDPLSHRVGVAVLENGPMRNAITSLYRMPLGPWFSLNNTVVVGGFTIGLAALLPVYFTMLPLMRWCKQWFAPPTSPKPAASQVQLRFDPPADVTLETHIDVVRLNRHPESEPARKAGTKPATVATANADANEALRYLVRHVRDSREEKAA